MKRQTKKKTSENPGKIARSGKSARARARLVTGDSIFDELRQMEDRIMRGAYEVFERNGRAHGRDVQDWLDAERELVWKPAIELREDGHEFIITIAIPGIDPRDLDIQVTAAHLLIKAEVCHKHNTDNGKVHTCEFQPGNLFRSVAFPKRIDPGKVRTEFMNGLLRLRAPITDKAASGPGKRRVP